jgi:hypothetical protein
LTAKLSRLLRKMESRPSGPRMATVWAIVRYQHIGLRRRNRPKTGTDQQCRATQTQRMYVSSLRTPSRFPAITWRWWRGSCSFSFGPSYPTATAHWVDGWRRFGVSAKSAVCCSPHWSRVSQPVGRPTRRRTRPA